MISVPTWKQVEDLYKENQNIHDENALKLIQILELEQLLYDCRILEMKDGSPCWCCVDTEFFPHEDACIKARQATEAFWKGEKK